MAVTATARTAQLPLPGGGKPGATVAVEPLLGGEVTVPPAMFERSGGPRPLELLRWLGIGTPKSNWWTVPVPAFLIHHPAAGPVLVDTGLHPSIAAKPSENLGGLAARFASPGFGPDGDVPSQLRARGIDHRDLGTVIMTHLHLDHASGISEFPGATFVLSAAEWDAATTVRPPFLHGYIHKHFDHLFDYRTIDYTRRGEVASYASFGRTVDLFGDGSIRLAFSPGHTLGHQSVICRLRDRDFVIAGDSIYTMAQLEGGPEPPAPEDRHTWRRSLRELKRFHESFPDAVIVPGHDPRTWPELDKRYE